MNLKNLIGFLEQLDKISERLPDILNDINHSEDNKTPNNETSYEVNQNIIDETEYDNVKPYDDNEKYENEEDYGIFYSEIDEDVLKIINIIYCDIHNSENLNQCHYNNEIIEYKYIKNYLSIDYPFNYILEFNYYDNDYEVFFEKRLHSLYIKLNNIENNNLCIRKNNKIYPNCFVNFSEKFDYKKNIKNKTMPCGKIKALNRDPLPNIEISENVEKYLKSVKYDEYIDINKNNLVMSNKIIE